MTTIQDIIDALEQVEDKSRELWFCENGGESYILGCKLSIDDEYIYIGDDSENYR